MIKKIISVIISLAVILSFASCKSNNGEADAEQNNIINGELQNPSKDNGDTTKKQTVKVTIPEGYTLVRISWLLRDKGLCTAEEFIEATQTYKEWLDLAKYPFLDDLNGAENVCFKLEGYFFPLTYDVPVGATAREIVEIFLRGTKQKFTPQLLSDIKNTGYNLHQILTLASVIEKEAKTNEQRVKISSVLHNRLKNKMKLQCDPTVKYCTGVIEPVYPDKLEVFKHYYNTYRCDGLMAGPICNSGMESIEAAIFPQQSENLYFIVGTVEPYEDYYFKTYDEHEKFWAENKDRLTGKAN